MTQNEHCLVAHVILLIIYYSYTKNLFYIKAENEFWEKKIDQLFEKYF